MEHRAHGSGVIALVVAIAAAGIALAGPPGELVEERIWEAGRPVRSGPGLLRPEIPSPIAPVGGIVVATVYEEDNPFDGILDYRGIETKIHDQRGNLAHDEYFYETPADGTVFEGPNSGSAAYDVHGNLVGLVRDRQNFDGSRDRVTEAWTYDTHDKPLRYVLERDTGADGVANSRIVDSWTYNSSGDLVLFVDEVDLDADGIPDNWVINRRSYNGRGALVRENYDTHDTTEEEVFNSRRAISYAYDSRDRLTLTETTIDRGADGTFDERSSEALQYDPKGLLESNVRVIDRAADGTIDEVRASAFDYDTRGNVLRIVEDASFPTVGFSHRFTTQRSYDFKGRLVLEIRENDFFTDLAIDDRFTDSWDYDLRGQLLRSVEVSDSGADGVNVYRTTVLREYDPRGNVVSLQETRDDGTDGVIYSRTRSAFTYDPRDTLVSEVTDRGVLDDGTILSRTTRRYERSGSGHPPKPAIWMP
jgi:hypothetical protein